MLLPVKRVETRTPKCRGSSFISCVNREDRRLGEELPQRL